MRGRGVLWMSVALGALFAAGLAHATDITVVDGETLTVPQILSGAGDTLTVETGGAIEVVTDTAVSATGSGVTITNAGKIWGLMSAVELGDGNTLYNSGTMTGEVSIGHQGWFRKLRHELWNHRQRLWCCECDWHRQRDCQFRVDARRRSWDLA